MSAIARYRSAREMMHEGRHEEALSELVWFHEHALEENRSLAGVRLSYALGAWVELARVYPPARAALERIRDRDTALLLEGRGDRGLFHDMAAIHRETGEQGRTHALFVGLEKVAPELAASCADIALPAIIAAGDFALAERLLPDPEKRLRWRAQLLNDDLRYRRRMRFTRAPFVATSINLYVDHVRELLAVLEGRGRMAEAVRLRTLAAELVPATTIRRAVRAALLPGARPWQERGHHPRRKRRLS